MNFLLVLSLVVPIAGALLAFALSLDDFVVSFFTSGPGSTTLPIYIYSSVKRGVSGEIHAISTMLILAALGGTIVVTWWQARNKKLPMIMDEKKHS